MKGFPGSEGVRVEASAAGPHRPGLRLCRSTGTFSAASRPTLLHIVIDSLAQEDEEIYDAHHGRPLRGQGKPSPYGSDGGAAALQEHFLLPGGPHSPTSLSTVRVRRMKDFRGRTQFGPTAAP